MAGMILLATVAFIGGRIGALEHPAVAPGVVVIVALVAIVVGVLISFDDGLVGSFLGYANARSAFFVQAAVAALMLIGGLGGWGKAVPIAAALAFAVALLASRSLGGMLSALPVALAAVAAFGGGLRKPVMVACVAAAAVAVAIPIGLAAAYAPDNGSPLTGRAVEALPERRLILWRDALDMMKADPLTGVGPGRFAEESAVARSDPDARWAHNGFLQVGAETGIIGFGLLVLLFGWGFARAWTSPFDPRLAVLVTGAISALAIHASVDYILNFPVIPMTTAAILGNVSRREGPRPGGPRGRSLVRKATKAAVLPMGLWTRRRPGDIVVLLYHRVGVGSREIDLPLDAFERQIAQLAEREEVKTLADALRDEAEGVVITFDDGTRDFHQHVLPLLERYKAPALLYLATGSVQSNGTRPSAEALTWSQLQESVATGLVTVGSHTHRHADLSGATEAVADEEMRRSKQEIEDHLGVACRDFAYPWAVGSPGADRAARRHFDTAALGAWRTNRRDRIDRWCLGRTPVLRSDGEFFFRAKVGGFLDPEAFVYRALRRGPWRAS
jgi:peptidoglycan/xylan/chitin deacetylase (PgdA/CDA1 family)